jgi:hypothetical protein
MPGHVVVVVAGCEHIVLKNAVYLKKDENRG